MRPHDDLAINAAAGADELQNRDRPVHRVARGPSAIRAVVECQPGELLAFDPGHAWTEKLP